MRNSYEKTLQNVVLKTIFDFIARHLFYKEQKVE